MFVNVGESDLNVVSTIKFGLLDEEREKSFI
jgi:hypothetical protein